MKRAKTIVKRFTRLIQIELRRLRNLRQFSRGPRYGLQSPRIGLWTALLLACAGLLFGLGEVVGRRPPSGSHHVLWHSLERAIREPSIALPLAFAILAAAAYTIRRLRLEFLAWQPGQIQVPDFNTQGMKEGAGAQLTSEFRHRLASMRLASAGATPATQPVSNFIDVLGATQAGASGIIATLLGLLKAAAPSYAYEIRGSVVQTDDRPILYRVSLQLVRLPNQGGMQMTVTNQSPEVAIREAADHATAAILPRTQLCRGPWVAWRRYKMPGGLFNAYEDACELEANNQNARALERYYRALVDDPMNWLIRLQLGQLQEKQQMCLEALATYTALIKAAEPTRARLSAGLYTRRAERERTRAFLIARYRRAVLLLDRATAEEWTRSQSPKKHSARRRSLHELREQLLLDELFEKISTEQAAAHTRGIDPFPQSLSKIFSDEAIVEIRLLRHELPISWKLARRPPLTARALDLTCLCILERAKTSSVNSTPGQLKKKVEDVEHTWKPRSRPFRRWKEHYNVACLYAIPLLASTPANKDAYARHAVLHLELAAACATSSYVASQHDWIRRDPDLAGLRRLPIFKAFEAGCFPTAPENSSLLRLRAGVRSAVQKRTQAG